MHYLQQLDQCGSDFKNRPLDENQLHKSYIGGIGSLIIYSSCLSYFIYGMYTWYDNQILPKVVNIQQYEPIVQTMIDDNLMGIKFKEQLNSTLNSPFRYSENILTMLLFKYNNGKLTITPMFSNDTSIIKLNNIYLASNQVNKTQTYFSVVISKCIQSYVGSCANQSVIDQFFSQRLTQLDFNIYVKQYNYEAKKYEQVEESFSYAITKFDTFYTQISLSMTKTKVYDNFLFGGSEDSVYISKFEQISQSPDISYMMNAFNETVYQTFFITVNNLIQHQQILYPTLGDVLASIGSIVNVLLLLRFIFIRINEQVCYELVVQKIISFYYPEFANQIFINRNFGGYIKSVFYNGVELDKQQFQQQYEELRIIAKNKLTFTNIIYEISRLQFLLCQLITKDQFLNSHNMGIKFKQKIIQEEELDGALDLSIQPEYFGMLNLLENSHQMHQNTRVVQQQM